jgi:inner membrane transporter RhtA
VTTPAALTLTLIAGWSTVPLLDAELLLIGLGLAILFPLVPFTLEFLACAGSPPGRSAPS